ncbi:MAG: hypothetical protein ACE5I7_01115 [Candidatus Binatia bacterium]
MTTRRETVQQLAAAVQIELTDAEIAALAQPVLDVIGWVDAATQGWEMEGPEPFRRALRSG